MAIAVGTARDSHAAMTFLCDLTIATKKSEFGSNLDSSKCQPAESLAERGNIDVLVEDIQEAVSAAQRFLTYWHEDISDFAASDSADDISNIVPENRRRPYDMRKVISAFADKDWEFLRLDWEQNDAYLDDEAGKVRHAEERSLRECYYNTEFWFDISSPFGE
mgnify:CR=1 FL=1